MYTDLQVMVTLATIAYVEMDPSGPPPTVVEQEQTLLEDIQSLLANPTLATGGAWTLPWVGLSRLQGNFAYIAQNTAANQIAVVLRGSVFRGNPKQVGPIDMYQDLAVSTTVPFKVGSQSVQISAGAGDAFGDVTKAVMELGDPPLAGCNMLEALTALVNEAAPNPTIYVTGHSLGGCLTTTVALYLQAALPSLVFQVYNFAGPTAGLGPFAELFNQSFPGTSSDTNSAWRVLNVWDVVPHAWQSLAGVETWYPSPGPAQNAEVAELLRIAQKLPDSNAYVQPTCGAGLISLNNPVWADALFDADAQKATVSDFLCQVAFQHFPNFSYMPLLDAPPLPGPPMPTPCSSEASGIAWPGLPQALFGLR